MTSYFLGLCKKIVLKTFTVELFAVNIFHELHYFASNSKLNSKWALRKDEKIELKFCGRQRKNVNTSDEQELEFSGSSRAGASQFSS